MSKHKVFIVGHEGTTGLRIHERLSGREDIQLLSIADEDRKDMSKIAAIAADAEIIFLCLPDAASMEVVEATKDLNCKIIDASTAFRTHPNWAYGFPELGADYKEKIATNRYIANPGCHASGMIAILEPLIVAGVVLSDYPVSIFSLTGYSGGGKKMIGQYESDDKETALYAPRQYGLGQAHKHMKEVVHICKLAHPPIFAPIVDDYYSGMEVSIGFHTALLPNKPRAKDIWQVLADQYKESTMVHVAPLDLEATNGLFLSANENTDLDTITIYVSGNDDRVMVHALFDNLGKGASGAAVQCMNIALGLPEETGLAR